MKVLLINNDSDTWSKLVRVVETAGHDITEAHYTRVNKYDPRNFDLVILSGGWWYDDVTELLREYADELQLIRQSPVPIFGICLGMQLMHVAVDQAVPLMDEPQSGDKVITINEIGQKLFHFPEQLEVFKNHTRAVIETDPRFEVLAHSMNHVEIMRHKTKPLLGVQFHPEAGPIDEAASRLNVLISGLIQDVSVQDAVQQGKV